MSTYVIGDLQGCFEPFMQLLKHIQFQPQTDQLWFTGDLVNRGPDSLAILRFVTTLPTKPIVVLGNHDLHLLAVQSGQATLRPSDTLEAILAAPDGATLCDWLRKQPLIYLDTEYGYTLVHGGLPPQWTSMQAKQYAQEVETVLMSTEYPAFFANMYGKKPDVWDPNLTGFERLRFIVNALTRIRFCTREGRLDFSESFVIGSQAEGLYPWFQIPHRASENENILFGHWAALEGKTNAANVFALDTGCVWGKQLTAMRLEDRQLFTVKCARIE